MPASSAITKRTRSNPAQHCYPLHDDSIIKQALCLLESRLFGQGPVFNNSQAVGEYLQLKLMPEPNEVFLVLFLNNQHMLLSSEILFQGTINTTPIYPRIVLQRALALNAAAVILAHNHPSGCTQPSEADQIITTRLKTALAMVDINVLDHIIIGQGKPFSFAETGLL